jgi:hypothetical protein
MSRFHVRDSEENERCSDSVKIQNLDIHRSIRGPNSKISQKKWTVEEDNKLLELAELAQGKKWKWVAKQLPGKKDTQCRSRWERIRPGMKQGRWSVEEDEILLKQYKIHGDKWSEIAKYLQHRTGKQVRDRFKNVYDSRINREEFTPEEDEFVYKVYVQLGPRWKHIRDAYFPDRTSDFIKNRFYSHYKKLEEKFRDQVEEIKLQDLSEFKLNNHIKNKIRLDTRDSMPSNSNVVFKIVSHENLTTQDSQDNQNLNFNNNSSEDEKDGKFLKIKFYQSFFSFLFNFNLDHEILFY